MLNLCSVLQAISAGERFLLSSHQSIDGDGLGSMLAFDSLLRYLRKETVMVYDGIVPYFYSFLPGVERVHSCERYFEIERPDSWVFVALDCSNPERMGEADRIRRQCGLVINIDHHPDNIMFGHVNLVDHDAPASSLLIYELHKNLGITIDSATAIQILTGLITDTGGFQFTELNPKLLTILGELVATGASVAAIIRYVFKYRRSEALRLLGRALNNLDYFPKYNCSITYLSREDFIACGAFEEDAEGIVDYGLHIQEAEISFFIKEMKPGHNKVSLRSQGRINVLPIAQYFGGGGHYKAAGFKINGTLIQVKDRLLACLADFSLTRNSVPSGEGGR
ncbi:MAG TPA: bifunctional oligoribonuclease/PAP phosphatase NrnA [Atribacteraceae bacterium]|nr:bifunctional oligoribonuclease/PAP phosphatase NrnA [Atribacteraceae bacterium]